mmetsp:Transcript_4553/g.4266  ORF Transcript_4553/g.4266 Transcript_4553/m.4266 type:complete len:119 (+) Transcript_4553:465-821(+)|eukprot:CAMPEP_0197002618 /NCGR_PEP_ID=MMETSP1380-20130617/7082_1 /TAXON_ID=5936 /ORGANISM="Euplotes crassus, Strain CT5" /LENGTH=118 /DNA_ID=CAMNT_0042420829 /DNA_START=441 /DNA_END=797 /DNA_ORIENTATION=+
MSRKASYENEIQNSEYNSKPSFKGSNKKDFIFTSNHIQMVEKSNKDEDEEKKARMFRTNDAKKISSIIGAKSPYSGHESSYKEKKNSHDGSISEVKEYAEPEIYLDTKSQTQNIKKNL